MSEPAPHACDLSRWEQEHHFTLDASRRGERRTFQVVLLTAVTMVLEISAGLFTGSMALLADGWHMASHAAALGISVFAYRFARRHARNERFSFGTGKVGALGGFASAVGLALIAALMLLECAERLVSPRPIRFDEAIAVAVLGLVVNLVSAWMLRGGHSHGPAAKHSHHHDHNLRAAYLHVIADGLTSAAAIVALVAGRFLGWTWLDAGVGVVASLVIARWAVGLMRQTGRVLLDVEPDRELAREIRERIEGAGDHRITDFHLWQLGPGDLAAIVSVVSHEPREPEHYKKLLAGCERLAHVTVEVNRCPGE